jgi:O-antigen/teichoic acid export membrane protein
VPGAPARSIDTGGRSLRSHAARGVIVNSAFDLGLSGLGLLQAFVVASLLTRTAYGVWGVLVASLGVLAQLKSIGVSDKYLQQEEQDQELAFQRAFTLEMLTAIVAVVVLGAALPLIALIYGHWSLMAPGAVVLTALVADALQSPLWIFYRRMDFVRQRLLGAVQPLVGFVVTVSLAAVGLGYWSLAVGLVAGAWAAAASATIASPYPLRWRYDSGTLRTYASFSAPIVVATVCTILLANGPMIAANARLGLAGAGALALAVSITQFTARVDALVSGTLYPAICAAQHRLDLLRETFVKTNRVALMWAVPMGATLMLFAGDLVHYALGERWRAAVGLLRITGIVAAISHVAFNWDDYFRARSDTRPIAVAAVVSTVALLGTGIPLLFFDGLIGLGIGIAVGAAASMVFRAWYVSRLFEGFQFLRHAARAVSPTVPAICVVLLMRLLERGPRTLAWAVAELSVFALVVILATWWIEGGLVREAVEYLLARDR